MKISEVKARIASLLDISPNDIVLRKQEGKASFEQREDGKLYITYSEAGTLVHEFLHACFTPRDQYPDLLLNALEDHRISVKAGHYDKKLQNANRNIMSDEEFAGLIGSIRGEDQVADSMRLMAALALPQGTKVDIQAELEEHLKNGWTSHTKKFLINKVQEIRERTERTGDYNDVRLAHEELKDYIQLPEGQQQGHPSYEGGVNQEETDESVAQNLKRSVNTSIPRLNSQEEFILKKGLKKIIQNRAIGKAVNTIEGKLVGKRLGRYPSTYLFKKKTNPSPDTHLYIQIDLSGSMYGTKLETVMKFVNTVRDLDIPHLKFKIRGFNLGYFEDEEIPYSTQEVLRGCLDTRDEDTGELYGEYNEDAVWLKETIKQIQNDPCENKALIILSDGRPAPLRGDGEKELKQVVNSHLIKSGIPYMSIGIEDKCVTKYYPKARVAEDASVLVKLLSKYSRELIKF